MPVRRGVRTLAGNRAPSSRKGGAKVNFRSTRSPVVGLVFGRWVLSFGSWIAMQLIMRRPELNGFVCVSPPVNERDFNFLAPCPSSGLIINGEKDTITSFESARILSEKLQKQKKAEITFKAVKGADHFYENHKSEFYSLVDNYIKKKLNKT